MSLDLATLNGNKAASFAYSVNSGLHGNTAAHETDKVIGLAVLLAELAAQCDFRVTDALEAAKNIRYHPSLQQSVELGALRDYIKGEWKLAKNA